MASSTLFILLLCSPTLTFGFPSPWMSLTWKRAAETPRKVPELGYYNPLDSGGSMLTKIPVTYPMGQGEPVNAIISGASDAEVLVDAEVGGGLRNYFFSLGFSGECLGQHAGSHQMVDLGDGNGAKNETSVIRWNYGDVELGSCKETIQGGNHFRYWVQNGPTANSGAIFMAVSYEMPIALQHDIVRNGYNFGRDYLIGNLTKTTVPTANLTDQVTYTASSSFNGYAYDTHVKYVSGMLPNTNDGINHNVTVGWDGVNSSDGLVAVMTVKMTTKPQSASAWRSAQMGFLKYPPAVLLVVFPLLFAV
ncbi:hypothetical protein BDZ94DRAFT_1254308 [Collybia nuda]|uniref:Uncharacterized protein n=1 Tax=Collybia nuda TaxID=64659 RepID=A0A9P5Y846_9AGAR|nr:hypothetical protein BDZ94DRAFT_1254308 [Collybia nuda]